MNIRYFPCFLLVIQFAYDVDFCFDWKYSRTMIILHVQTYFPPNDHF